jgi:para-nitrobenzyl esterase
MKTVSRSSLSRRAALKRALTAVAGTAVAAAAPRTIEAEGAAPATESRRVVASDAQTVVETSAGKIRGCANDGIFTFKGVPYAEPATGERRFMPPVKASAWAGVRNALAYGPVCPTGIADPTGGDNAARADEDAFLLYRVAGRAGEDCLRLNVWTPSTSGGRRPVMVYMHGGGFTSHSSSGLASYDGTNLARRHDVVVITHNHRLNTLGYLDLSEIGGERYARSGNLGMLDIVAVLEWVRDNAARFGGDPQNVTIFGQSGGGGKVSALMGMPAAKGLFHRAIVQSGSQLRMRDQQAARRLAAAVASELGLSAGRIGDLHTMSLSRFYGAVVAATAKLTAEAASDSNPAAIAPVVDGVVLPAHPFDPGASAISTAVPMLVGTNENEMVHGVDNPGAAAMTESQALERLKRYAGSARPIFEAYRREYPKYTPWQIFAAISAAGARQNAFTQAARKAALGGAPAYQYMFSWRTPVLDGRPGTFHSAEIAFVFDNVDLCANLTGGDPAGAQLATLMSSAWTSFAKNGKPAHSGLPEWPAFAAERESTMVFDAPCQVRHQVEREGRKLVAQATSA